MITPNWNVPTHIKAISTTRIGGFSLPPFNSNNLGMHVGDNAAHVLANREKLALQLPNPPHWLDQRHTTSVIEITSLAFQSAIAPVADASITKQSNAVCCVMTADCLPILLTDKLGTQVAAIHAGWRGLCDGIIENTVAQFGCPAQDIIAWLGPAIGPHCFEVGQDVFDKFCQHFPADKAFFVAKGDRYLANLYQLARARMKHLGIKKITGGEYCTYSQSDMFFSYRRDGQTGRMASMIWINK